MRKILLAAALTFGSMTSAAYAADSSSLPLLNGVSNAVLTETEMKGVQGEGELVTLQVNNQINVCAGYKPTCQQANQNIQQIGAGNVAVNVLEQAQEITNTTTTTTTPPKKDNGKHKGWKKAAWKH